MSHPSPTTAYTRQCFHKTKAVLDFGNHKGRHHVDDFFLKWMVKTVTLTRSHQQQINVHDLLSLLKSCSRKKDLQEGRRIHINAVETGNDSNIFVAAALINMYAKCGSMVDAHRVFDSIENPDLVSWNALILGYAGNGKGQAALNYFSRMKTTGGCAPSSVTYIAAIKACTCLAADEAGKEEALKRGREIHTEIGHHMKHSLQNTLIHMYGKCGSMESARRVFSSIDEPDVISWNALILGYAENGEGQISLDFFSRMKAGRGCVPDSVTYLAAIKACISLASDEAGKVECLERGREIHGDIGHHMNYSVQSTLINMYAKCGSMVDARRVFDNISEPDTVTWNALILGYAENGETQAALDFFSKMKTSRGCAPDSVTYIGAVKACTWQAGDQAEKEECLKRGMEIHVNIGHHMNHFIQNTLISMYASCSSMQNAQRVFDSIEEPDVVSWSSLILGYADNGEGEVALELFSRMKAPHGCAPNSMTYVATIKACASLAADETGKTRCMKQGSEIHKEIGHHVNHFVQNALINMYARCGSMINALEVFDSIEEPDVVSWNSLILGYADSGEGRAAMDVFSRMKGKRGCAPDSVTYLAALSACISLAEDAAGKGECLKWGREIHADIGQYASDSVKSKLINMYAKCGNISDARQVFDSMEEPDVVSWNALILGYAVNGESQSSLDMFSRMKAVRGCVPNSVTYLAAFKACSTIGALAVGRKIHSEITDIVGNVMSCLVDFYAKCGSMIEAREVFDSQSSSRNIGTWTALLAGYGRFGDSSSVFELFEAMQDQGFQPDAVTFVCMLLCCSHAGLVQKAREYLQEMPVKYGVTPTVKHYTCMIDVLGRTNQLEEAVSLLQAMPCKPDAVTWITLLGACRKWKNVEIGRLVFQSLREKSTSACILMAEIYASKGMWKERERVFETRREIGAWKLDQRAYVMDGMRPIKFGVGEEDPDEVTYKLKQLLEDIKASGESIVTPNEEEALCSHSERRAVVYGILKTPPGEPVRAFKNMRMCDDCHWATKNFSKLSGRIIIVRDESGFHVMENGICSCREYW